MLVLRIGIFTTKFPYKGPFGSDIPTGDQPLWGGVEEATYQLALALNELGHEIKIFTTSLTGGDEVQEYENITVYRYKKLFKVQHTPISFGLLKEPLKHDVDVVHIQRGSPSGVIAGYIYSKIKKKPFVVTYHNDPVTGGESLMRENLVNMFGKFQRRILMDADIITTLSLNLFKKSKFLRDICYKVKIVPNGVNSGDFNSIGTKYRHKNTILFVGSLTEWKAPHVLLKSLGEVVKKFPDLRAIFVGDGILKEKLRTLSLELGLQDCVIFKGFIINEEEKIKYYKSAEILVMPSYSEGFPITLLEASAFGLLLIVSDIEEFKAFIEENHNGVFFRVGDSLDLANKITKVLEDERLKRKFGYVAKEKVRRFNWKNIAKIFCRIYNDIQGSDM